MFGHELARELLDTSKSDLKALSNMPGSCRVLRSGAPRLMLENRWLSVDEIAEYFGIRRDAVYKWIERKDMPAHRAGRLWKFKAEEIDEWVRSGGAHSRSRMDSGSGPLRLIPSAWDSRSTWAQMGLACSSVREVPKGISSVAMAKASSPNTIYCA